MTWLRAAVLLSLVAIGSGCWPTRPPTKPPTKPPTTPTTTPATTLNKNCKCGVPNRGTRIVNGNTVDKNEYPWQVGITVSGTGTKKIFCGGSIVSSMSIVTAAHCFDKIIKRNRNIGKNRGFIWWNWGSGIYTAKDRFNVVVAEHSTSKPDGEKYYRVCTLEYHDKYKYYKFDYDYAVLTLCDELDWAKDVAPVCLPETSGQGTKHEQVNSIATGWGVTTVNEESRNILREVPLETLSNRACCTGSYKWGCDQITDRMICAAPSNGNRGTCKGDSGGPLIHQEGKSFTLIGITSFGNTCDKNRVPDVFARVTNQLDWIKERMKGQTCPRG